MLVNLPRYDCDKRLTEAGQRVLQLQNSSVLYSPEQAHNLIVLEATCADAIHSRDAVTGAQSITALCDTARSQAANAWTQALVHSTWGKQEPHFRALFTTGDVYLCYFKLQFTQDGTT
jgi:hypothetical protein